MASTTFLAEVRLRLLFELEPDCGSSDCVIAGDGLAKSGAVAGNLSTFRKDSILFPVADDENPISALEGSNFPGGDSRSLEPYPSDNFHGLEASLSLDFSC